MPARSKWVLAEPPPPDRVHALAAEFALSPAIISLAVQRGFDTPEKLAPFLYPRLRDLSDPFELPGMTEAVARIGKAIHTREKVLLYGDYDVDGVSSLAILHKVLGAYGLDAKTFLPQRMEEGYGLSREGLARGLADCSPTLVIAADCGTNSRDEARHLAGQGIDLVILDHHEPAQEGTAECVALVNPKLGDRRHYLCTGGVAFKVAHALLKTYPLPEFDLRQHLDLVSLATVADIVPVVDENRIFVRRGLVQLDRTLNPGILALKNVVGMRAPARSHDIGFKLGPRLNASGRLDTAEVSLELLLTPDPNRARVLADELDRRNGERQALEQRTRDEAERCLHELSAEDRGTGIVVGGRGWHPGVVGIVASRIVKQHHRPTFVVAIDENGLGKGSGRSVPGISLIGAIEACRDLLENGGGHDMAAGISIREENLPEFQRRFAAHIAATAVNGELQPRLHLDAEADFGDLTLDLLDSYELLRPFGNGNPQPVFMSRNVRVLSEPRVLKEKHLKFRLAQNGAERDALYFNGAEVDLPRPPWDIAYTIDRNEYRGQTSLTIAIQAVRKASGRG